MRKAEQFRFALSLILVTATAGVVDNSYDGIARYSVGQIAAPVSEPAVPALLFYPACPFPRR